MSSVLNSIQITAKCDPNPHYLLFPALQLPLPTKTIQPKQTNATIIAQQQARGFSATIQTAEVYNWA